MSAPNLAKTGDHLIIHNAGPEGLMAFLSGEVRIVTDPTPGSHKAYGYVNQDSRGMWQAWSAEGIRRIEPGVTWGKPQHAALAVLRHYAADPS